MRCKFMIVIGYQGIGKSTLAGRNNKFIDLESSNFRIDGKRTDDWYKPYCKVAEHLSQQGYIVFTSSHEVVREYLVDNSREIVVLVYPSIELEDAWIGKLEKRYEKSGLDKDYRALMNAIDRFEDNIRELQGSCIEYKLELQNMNYDLEASLIHLKNELDGWANK